MRILGLKPVTHLLSLVFSAIEVATTVSGLILWLSGRRFLGLLVWFIGYEIEHIVALFTGKIEAKA